MSSSIQRFLNKVIELQENDPNLTEAECYAILLDTEEFKDGNYLTDMLNVDYQ